MKIKKNGAGFTLIELLIAISIIAILSVVGLSVYQSVYKNSRDAKRQSDLKLIQSALEEYHSDQTYYPYSGSVISRSSLTNVTGGSSSTISRTYLNNVPADPVSSSSYSYKAYKVDSSECVSTDVGKCTKYCIYASLEGVSAPILSGCAALGSYNFAVTPP